MLPRNPVGRTVHSLCFLNDNVSPIRYIIQAVNLFKTDTSMSRTGFVGLNLAEVTPLTVTNL